jgi:hypothetical protein
MSNLQTQISIVHLESGFNMTSAVQTVSGESSFSTDAVTVTVTDEAVDLGDIITPKVVCIKLVSGDPVKIGIGGSTYPFRLQEPGESTLLRLDVEGLREITTLTTGADVNGSLGGTHIELRELGDDIVWPWFDTGVKASGTITYGSPAAVAATGTLTLTANPTDGETVELGGQSYTFKTALSAGGTVADEVLIGALATNSLDNLVDAIMAGAGAGTLHGTGTVANASASAAAGAGDTVVVTALVAGESGNLIETTDSLVNGSWGGGALSGGEEASTVTVADETFSYVATAPDPLAGEFSNAAELEAFIEAIDGLSASETAGVITITADAPGLLGNEYTLATTGVGFALSAASLTGGADTGETAPTGTFDRLLPITLPANSTDEEVAAVLAAALEADAGFVASAVGAVVTIASQHTGNLTASTVGNTGWAALGASTQEGAASPVVWFKSTGTSQIGVAVAPA